MSSIQPLQVTGGLYPRNVVDVVSAPAPELGRSAAEVIRDMTPLQQELIQQLRQAAGDTGGGPVVYRTAYLGYLPFGQYQWVTVRGEDVTLACPDGWGWRDLEALADAGALTRVTQWTNPQDDSDRVSQYDLAASEAEQSYAPSDLNKT